MVRRFLPWALLGLLVVGVAVGAAVGQTQSPVVTPAQWVAGVVAATEATGSAHLHYVNVTTSQDPSEASVVSGAGVVDFTEGTFRVTETYRQHQFESINGGPLHLTADDWGQQTIAIGQTLYMNFTSGPPFGGWTKTHLPRDEHQDLGLDATGAEDALGGFVGPTPVDAVRTLGPGSVDGVAATRYLVTTEPLYICGAHGRTIYVHQFAPTTVWVDGQGRLLRARTSFNNEGFTSHGPDGSASAQPISVAPSTTNATLTLSYLGAPVQITAPPLTGTSGVSSSSSIALRANGSTTPCHG